MMDGNLAAQRWTLDSFDMALLTGTFSYSSVKKKGNTRWSLKLKV